MDTCEEDKRVTRPHALPLERGRQLEASLIGEETGTASLVVKLLKAINVSEEDKANILGDNAAGLFKL